jgi:hypothetical protein
MLFAVQQLIVRHSALLKEGTMPSFIIYFLKVSLKAFKFNYLIHQRLHKVCKMPFLH